MQQFIRERGELNELTRTFGIYAFLYGSGIPNLARVCGVTQDEMQECVNNFMEGLPSLNNLIENAQRVARDRGFFVSLDGRRGRIRMSGGKAKEHTALNLLLQMTGSLVMKWAHIIAEDLAVEEGLIKNIAEFPIVAHQHDELQMDVSELDIDYIDYVIPKDQWKDEEKKEMFDEEGYQLSAAFIIDEDESTYTVCRAASKWGALYAKAITLAGEKLGLRCPTAGEWKTGDSWYDTH